MTKYTILPTWLTGLTPEQQQLLLYAIVEYYEGRVVDVPDNLLKRYFTAQSFADGEITKQENISIARRKAVNTRWQKHTNDTNDTNVSFVDTKHTNNTNVQFVLPIDPQPLTPPDLPEPPLAPAPAHVINPTHSILPTNTSSYIYNNIIYNKDNYKDITEEDINNIRQIIDAYNSACDKQNVANILMSLLHQQAWLTRPLLNELTAYLLLCDTARKENYMSVETRLMQAYSTMNKNIETLRQSLLQSVAQNWRTLVPPKNEIQYGTATTETSRERQHSIIDAIYDHYQNGGQ